MGILNAPLEIGDFLPEVQLGDQGFRGIKLSVTVLGKAVA